MIPSERAKRKLSEFGVAAITGGSSGIGVRIIERLEKLDPSRPVFNLSRTKPDTFFDAPSVTHLGCDLSKPEERKLVFSNLLQKLSSVGNDCPLLLVNNAGYGLYGTVESQPAEEQLQMIQVNIGAVVELTIALLPLLRERGGAVVNIASTAAFQPTPYFATYAATKAFVLNWTLALNHELRDFPKSARALAACPGPTRTRFFKRAGLENGIEKNGLRMDTDRVVDLVFEALAKDTPYIVTGGKNKALASLSSFVPRAWATRAAAKAMGHYRLGH